MEWDTALQSEDWALRTSLARFTNQITLPFDGTWSRWEASKILIKNRPQVWYILISDCLYQSHDQFPDLGYIDYEIEMKNDGSHFSHEHYGQLPITFVALVAFAYFLLTAAIKFFQWVNKWGYIRDSFTYLNLCCLLWISPFIIYIYTSIYLLVQWKWSLDIHLPWNNNGSYVTS